MRGVGLCVSYLIGPASVTYSDTCICHTRTCARARALSLTGTHTHTRAYAKGNCQFRAVADQLFGSQDQHATVRDRAVAQVS